VESGASMCDIMSDIFDPSPRQLTKKQRAIDKQKKLIDQIHSMGAEVLMSSHTGDFLTAEETIEHAKAMENRGADMIKIVVKGTSEAEMQEAFQITSLLKKELKVPFLHICAGQYGKIHRAMAPLFGSALVLCVQSYTAGSYHEQVLLRAIKAVYDNLDRTVGRNEWPDND
jgi:3-dehydroquinate dehydratase type I